MISIIIELLPSYLQRHKQPFIKTTTRRTQTAASDNEWPASVLKVLPLGLVVMYVSYTLSIRVVVPVTNAWLHFEGSSTR